jgi:glycosyltransferase involved in cell wall biosynthesis
MPSSRDDWSMSLVLNCHREGSLVASAFRSLEAAAYRLMQIKIPVEVILCVDKPDELTIEVAEVLKKRSHLPTRLFKLDFGDLSDSRNHAVKVAFHQWIAFLDADDLWSINWLEQAYLFLQTSDNPKNLILHPFMDLFFPDALMHLMPNQDLLEDPLGILLSDNVWDSLSLAHRSVYLNHPFQPNRLSEGFGYEDWAWNYETIRAGFIHRVVKQTCHFKRRSPNSLSKRSETLSVLVTPPLP